MRYSKAIHGYEVLSSGNACIIIISTLSSKMLISTSNIMINSILKYILIKILFEGVLRRSSFIMMTATSSKYQDKLKD